MRILMLLFLLNSITQLGLSQTFTASQTKEDLKALVTGMQQYNPALLLYNPTFLQQADSLIQSVQGDQTAIQSFGLVTQLVSLGNEGHYGLGSWEDSVHQGFTNNTYQYLPMGVRVLDNKLYVWDCYTESNPFTQGDEILSINGATAGAIIQSMYRFVSSDGHIIPDMNRRLTDGFSWMYYLFMEQTEKFDLSVRSRSSGAISAISIPALYRKQMVENVQARPAKTAKSLAKPGSVEDVYALSFTDSIAFLKLKSFDWRLIKDYKLNAKKMYKSIFSTIAKKGSKYLVVDLRDNTGGRYEFASGILPYILTENKKGVFKTSHSWKGKTKPYKIPAKSKAAFSGQIYGLVNERTFSAGASLARYLREYGQATMIGTEAAGRYEGYSAGSSQSVYLPHTGIKIGIPRYHTEFPPSQIQKTRNRGLIPDHPVSYTIDDLISKTDKARALVLQLIQGK